MIVTQVLAAALGTVAFALLFGVPRKYYLYCGFIGGAGWLLYCLLEPVLNATEATFFCFCTGDIPVTDGGSERKMSGYHIPDIRNNPACSGSGNLLVGFLYGYRSAGGGRRGRFRCCESCDSHCTWNRLCV